MEGGIRRAGRGGRTQKSREVGEREIIITKFANRTARLPPVMRFIRAYLAPLSA